MKRRSVLTAVALLAGLAAPVRAQQDDAGSLLASGRAAFEAGDYELARERLWAYLEATRELTGPSRLPQAEALYTIALMEPDAGVAARHYETILAEYPAATVADEAAFRLGLLALMEGRTEAARERLQTIARGYPFSRVQPELPLWIGRTYMEERQYRAATDHFIDGFTRVKSNDLPMEVPLPQREALAAEYAWWLAQAFREEGDVRTATQYYSLLTLDYPSSPQATDARRALEELGRAELAGPPAAEAGFPVVVEPGPADETPAGEAQGAGFEERGPEVARAEPEIAGAEPELREEIAPPAPPPAIEEDVDDEGRAVAPPPTQVVPEPAREEPPVTRPAPPADRRADVGPAAIAAAPPEGARSRVYLQVGAFASATRAADLSKRLKADGFDTKIEVGVVDGQGYYRVRVGPFRLPEETGLVDANRRRLEARGYPAQQVPAE